MKRALVVVTILGMSTQALADGRDDWQAAFAGSVTVAVSGVIVYMHGKQKVDDAEDALCKGGAYSTCMSAMPITQAEVDRLNAKGERGQTVANIGWGLMVAGTAVAAFALYKGFIQKREQSGVTVAPSVSPQGAGATLQLRW